VQQQTAVFPLSHLRGVKIESMAHKIYILLKILLSPPRGEQELKGFTWLTELSEKYNYLSKVFGNVKKSYKLTLIFLYISTKNKS
jgi:hypothetical protein